MPETGQCVAVFACHNNKNSLSVEKVIKGILQKEKLDEICEEKEFYLSYPWNIANKYYEAAVDVCHVKQKNIVSQLFSSEVEAVVAVFDSKKEAKSIAGLDSWLSYVNVWNPEIKLAVCERCSSVDDKENEHINREEILSWCIDNEFELVELDPIQEDYAEDEDFGFKRLCSALSAHMWPNMEMRTSKQSEDSISHENNAEIVTTAADKKPTPIPPTVEERLDSLLGEENLDTDGMEENFEALFQKMRVFKETAASKSGSSRMDYAEQVVTAFWRAIGGDEEELKGQSSDEGNA